MKVVEGPIANQIHKNIFNFHHKEDVKECVI